MLPTSLEDAFDWQTFELWNTDRLERVLVENYNRQLKMWSYLHFLFPVRRSLRKYIVTHSFGARYASTSVSRNLYTSPFVRNLVENSFWRTLTCCCSSPLNSILNLIMIGTEKARDKFELSNTSSSCDRIQIWNGFISSTLTLYSVWDIDSSIALDDISAWVLQSLWILAIL